MARQHQSDFIVVSQGLNGYMADSRRLAYGIILIMTHDACNPFTRKIAAITDFSIRNVIGVFLLPIMEYYLNRNLLHGKGMDVWMQVYGWSMAGYY